MESKIKIGLFGAGPHTYLAQFDRLAEKLNSIQKTIKDRHEHYNTEVVDAVMVDNTYKTISAARLITGSGFTIVLLFFSALCQAQCDSVMKPSEYHYNIKLAYNSSLIYPGASAGIEFRIKEVNMQIIKRNKKSKSFTRSRFLSGNLNWYHHTDFHDNLYLTAEWVMRRTNSKGFVSEFSLGPGFSRTFLGGTTYRVNDSGDISKAKLAGYNYALITIGEGFGFDFSVKKQKPFSAVAKLNLISMFPYNSTFYIRPVLELGIRYMPLQGKCKLMKN